MTVEWIALTPTAAMEQPPNAAAESRVPRRILATVAILVSACAANAALEVNVTRVGYPTLSGADVVRPGMWTPVVVDLSLVNQSSFDGIVRAGQLDQDGDEAVDQVEVHVTAATGGHQRVTLYVLPSFVGRQGRLVVEVQTMEGETVEVVTQGELARLALPGRLPEPIHDEDLLILSVSTGTVGRLGEVGKVELEGGFDRHLHIAHLSPIDLPEHWIGLEGVDAIRWEDANPVTLSQKQVSALIEWVRQGGMLLMTLSTAESAFALKKAMDEVLPAEPGEPVFLERLDLTFSRLLQPTSDATEEHAGYATPVAALRMVVREGAEVLAREEGIQSDLVTRRREGRGSIILSGVTEREMFSANGSPTDFYRRVFCLKRSPGGQEARPDLRTLFGEVVSAISFSTSGGAYLAVAGLFSIAYVVAATFGSWAFLVARGWKHHSWTAFAVVAVLAATGTVFAVNSVRGFGERLHQVTIVDAEAGKGYGHATTLFGLKTGTDRVLDLWLPTDGRSLNPVPTNTYLRPIRAIGGLDAALNSFADPQSYRLSPSTAEIQGVRMRATLKQFEGRWEGRMGGKVSARITLVPKKAGEFGWWITEDSFVSNELGVPLKNCYLLQPLSDTFSPIERTFEREDFDGLAAYETDRNRGSRINAFPIGDLPGDGSRVALWERCYRPMAGSRDEYQEILDWKLDAAQKSWNQPLLPLLQRGFDLSDKPTSVLGNERNALLLLSTLGELEPTTTSFAGSLSWSHDGLRHLDLREQLQRDCVYLIGFAEGSGPVRLYRRQGDRSYTPIEADEKKSWTLYRVRIPVTLVSRSATGFGSKN